MNWHTRVRSSEASINDEELDDVWSWMIISSLRTIFFVDEYDYFETRVSWNCVHAYCESPQMM